ncbi:hypothetical protein GGS20DRAFT_286679 [Poronia punctata]|nr:hypothetical protein GGS20DRAFT_286679 [Poronia punctata]
MVAGPTFSLLLFFLLISFPVCPLLHTRYPTVEIIVFGVNTWGVGLGGGLRVVFCILSFPADNDGSCGDLAFGMKESVCYFISMSRKRKDTDFGYGSGVYREREHRPARWL